VIEEEDLLASKPMFLTAIRGDENSKKVKQSIMALQDLTSSKPAS